MGKGINPNLKIKARSLRPIDEYTNGLQVGDRYILSECLTLIESTNVDQRLLGEEILNTIDTREYKHTIRIGITGSPGAGKSTFIEALGSHLTKEGKKVAVLAVDPSSTKSHGSILGDKTRMSSLSVNPNAFVRPTASSSVLGGVARATKESISLCEAAGYDVVIVESVGVGQSETELADLVDVYLLLLLPGGGDGVQGIKRGVMELADIMAINKCDGDRKLIAQQSQRDFASAVRLFHHEMPEWKVPVELCSALNNNRIDTVWKRVVEYVSKGRKSDFFVNKRGSQDQKWIKNQIRVQITKRAAELFELDKHLNAQRVDMSNSVFKALQLVKIEIERDFMKYSEKKN